MKAFTLVLGILNLLLVLGLGFVFYQQHQQLEKHREAEQVLKKEVTELRQLVQVQRMRIDQLLQDDLPRAEAVRFRDKVFDTYTVDLNEQALALFLKDSLGNQYRSLTQLKNTVEDGDHWLVFATNAGMYTPQYTPVGLYIEKGTEFFPLDTKDGRGNFYLKPNGVFYVGDQGAGVVESGAFAELTDSVQLATQSGPLLVLRDSIHPAFNEGSPNLNIRSGVGILSPEKVVFAISNEPTNFYDFAMLFKEYFGCSDALYLDGAISRMYLPALNRFELGGDFGPMLGIVQQYPLE